MTFNKWTDGDILYDGDLNSSFQPVDETANANQLSSGTTYVTGGNFFNVNFDVAGTLNLLSTTTGLTQIAPHNNSDLQIFYAPAPDLAASTSIAVQTLYIGMPYTITQGVVVNDSQVIKQYGDGGMQDFTDTTYWTLTGGGSIANGNRLTTNANVTTYLDTNDLSSYGKLTTLVGGENLAASGSGRLYWFDNSTSGNIVTLVDSSGTIDDKALVEVFLDSVNSTYLIYLDGVYNTSGTYDTFFKLRYYATGGSTNSSRVWCYFLGLGNAATTSTVTHELTADGGSNWESVTNKQGHEFTNTGTSFAYRNTFTLEAGDIYLLRYGMRFGGF